MSTYIIDTTVFCNLLRILIWMNIIKKLLVI